MTVILDTNGVSELMKASRRVDMSNCNRYAISL